MNWMKNVTNISGKIFFFSFSKRGMLNFSGKSQLFYINMKEIQNLDHWVFCSDVWSTTVLTRTVLISRVAKEF